jgi:hypothetical protein
VYCTCSNYSIKKLKQNNKIIIFLFCDLPGTSKYLYPICQSKRILCYYRYLCTGTVPGRFVSVWALRTPAKLRTRELTTDCWRVKTKTGVVFCTSTSTSTATILNKHFWPYRLHSFIFFSGKPSGTMIISLQRIYNPIIHYHYTYQARKIITTVQAFGIPFRRSVQLLAL